MHVQHCADFLHYSICIVSVENKPDGRGLPIPFVAQRKLVGDGCFEQCLQSQWSCVVKNPSDIYTLKIWRTKHLKQFCDLQTIELTIADDIVHVQHCHITNTMCSGGSSKYPGFSSISQKCVLVLCEVRGESVRMWAVWEAWLGWNINLGQFLNLWG